MSEAQPGKVFLLYEWHFEQISDTYVHATLQGAQRRALDLFSASEDGWLEKGPHVWEHAVSGESADYTVTIEEHDVGP